MEKDYIKNFIIRKYKEVESKPISGELSILLFPVDSRKVYWETNRKQTSLFSGSSNELELTRHYYAIVDKEEEHLFTIVSDSYVIVSNKDAYCIEQVIASYMFMRPDNNENFEFIPYNVWLRKDRASCEVSIVRKLDMNQPDIMDGWTACMTMLNSYNKSVALTYYIGFVNTKYNLSILLPENSIKFKLKKNIHNDLIDQVAEQLAKSENNDKIRIAEDAFIKKLKQLKNAPMDDNLFLAFFCKFFRISQSTFSRMKDGHDEAIRLRDFINERKALYINQYGKNAYSFLLGISDYISNSRDRRLENKFSSYHVQAGQWVDDYLDETSKPKFSLYKYIGEEALNTASWLSTLK